MSTPEVPTNYPVPMMNTTPKLAEEMKRRGWSPPLPILRTQEEMDACAAGTIGIDANDQPVYKINDTPRWETNWTDQEWDGFPRPALPVRVLFVPPVEG